jgi:hypothetical protein
MLGAYAFPRAGEMSRKPTSGGDETMGWQTGSAVGRKPAGHRRSGGGLVRLRSSWTSRTGARKRTARTDRSARTAPPWETGAMPPVPGPRKGYGRSSLPPPVVPLRGGQHTVRCSGPICFATPCACGCAAWLVPLRGGQHTVRSSRQICHAGRVCFSPRRGNDEDADVRRLGDNGVANRICLLIRRPKRTAEADIV